MSDEEKNLDVQVRIMCQANIIIYIDKLNLKFSVEILIRLLFSFYLQVTVNIMQPEQTEEYIYDHLQVMFDNELRFLPSPPYMTNQTEIDEDDRNTIISWMIVKHYNTLNLLPKTLFLAVNILDRFLGINLFTFFLQQIHCHDI